jgi:copper resistance protein D
VAADGAHWLAAGAWLGGLLQLAHLVGLATRFPSLVHTAYATAALVRFSGMGYTAVAVLIGTGLINSWFLVGRVAHLATLPYGQVLSAKLCLFAGMLVLAAPNRFRLVATLTTAKESQPPDILRRLHRNVLGEQVLAILIVLIVGFLGTMQPSIGAPQ